MTSLPNQVNFVTSAGSQWAQTFQFTGVDITGLAWEFVIRPTVTDTAQPPLVKVTPTVTAQGQITVDTAAKTVQVILTPAATSLLGKGSRPYALWSNPGAASATPWCAGTFNTTQVPAP
ncbi:hypothetical protein AAW14_06455 [Streptomyces hygroscopicus]|uniref:hypothetical protein n=1 Tax=Streptomyces hygroscopicus TaxID=1912 RepID=UPI00223F719F|nr:hypothetical protein [Streptomyces hygroscopicus]MCW7941680.1 hypothetical protein [Streptomyces hygroscopicus]